MVDPAAVFVIVFEAAAEQGIDFFGQLGQSGASNTQINEEKWQTQRNHYNGNYFASWRFRNFFAVAWKKRKKKMSEIRTDRRYISFFHIFNVLFTPIAVRTKIVQTARVKIILE